MDPKILSKVSDSLLTSASFRKSFRSNPLGTASFIGVKGTATEELDMLQRLTDEEIETLADIREKLIGAEPMLAAGDITGGVLF